MKPRIMYIERKEGVTHGTARIGRVTYSQTGRTLYYAGRQFIRIQEYKANYMDVETRATTGSPAPKSAAATLFLVAPSTSMTMSEKSTGAQSETFPT